MSPAHWHGCGKQRPTALFGGFCSLLEGFASPVLSREAGTTVVGFPVHVSPLTAYWTSCLAAREDQGRDRGVPQALMTCF